MYTRTAAASEAAATPNSSIRQWADEAPFEIGSTEIRVRRVVRTHRTDLWLRWSVNGRLGRAVLRWNDCHADRARMEADARAAVLAQSPNLVPLVTPRSEAIVALPPAGMTKRQAHALEVLSTAAADLGYSPARIDVSASGRVTARWRWTRAGTSPRRGLVAIGIARNGVPDYLRPVQSSIHADAVGSLLNLVSKLRMQVQVANKTIPASLPSFLRQRRTGDLGSDPRLDQMIQVGTTAVSIEQVVYGGQVHWSLTWEDERQPYAMDMQHHTRHADPAAMKAEARAAVLAECPLLTRGHDEDPRAIAARVNAHCKDGVLCVEGSYEAGCVVLGGYCAVITTDREQSFYAQFRCDVEAKRSAAGQWTVRAFRDGVDYSWSCPARDEQRLAEALFGVCYALRRQLGLDNGEAERWLIPGLADELRAAGLDLRWWEAPAVAPDQLYVSANGTVDAPGGRFRAEVECWVGETGRLEYAAMARHGCQMSTYRFYGNTAADAVGELIRRIDEVEGLEQEMMRQFYAEWEAVHGADRGLTDEEDEWIATGQGTRPAGSSSLASKGREGSSNRQEGRLPPPPMDDCSDIPF